MIKNKLVILSFITIIVIVAASIFANLRAPQSQKEKIPFFPELANQIESISAISIEGYSESINLTRENNIWGIDEFDGYPALLDKVKSTVLGAADLKINAPKTALPRLYHRLGVEGPDVEDTNSLLLTLYGSNKDKIIEVIVGKSRLSSSAKNISGLYVRKPKEEKSYLVDGVLDISSIKTDWINRNLFDVPAESVKSVNISHSDGDSYTLYKDEQGQEKFDLENMPIGQELASELIINRFGTILQDVQISGAKSKKVLSKQSKNTHIKIKTFEGIVGHVIAFKHDDIAYASFEFSYEEEIGSINNEEEVKDEDIKKFIANLNSDTKNWWFEIPEFKYDIIKRRLNTITRDIQSTSPEEVTE